ncbi:hypothetical protein V1L52_06905 [Treponema sp. HNW]|uniref:hypothetical protein n=1 Tax=Treponema sp. HNW TaxID=3116654 RepID=UPI003D1053C5
MSAATVCGILLFFISCVSVPDKKDDSYAQEAARALTEETAESETEGLISPDDTREIKKPSGKKTSGAEAKKLTVIYEEEKTEAPDLLGEYKTLLEGLNLRSDKAPPPVKNGNTFASDFSVLVTDARDMPVQGVSITVKYPSDNLNGTIVFASEDIISDEEGRAFFTSPLPEFSCLSEILFYISPEKTDEAVLSYAEEIALRMPYRVYTDKTHKTISVSVLDYNQSGKPVRSNSFSSSAFLKALYKKGFRRAGNADFIDEINGGKTDLLYKNAAALFRGTVDYLIFGTVKYKNPVEQTADGLYGVTLTAELSVMDMKSGALILNTSQDFFAQDKGEWQLLDGIRNNMIGPALADFLYYNF